MLGAADNENQARSLLSQHSSVDGARRVLEEVWEFWKRNLGGVYVETPDESVNLLVNHWLPYQTLASRLWGRSGFYQSGGAFGFRDQLQDSLALLYECPWFTRQQLVLSSSRQFQNGDVQHWWHPPSGRGVRTRISDDYLWLPYAVCRYVAVTGDTGDPGRTDRVPGGAAAGAGRGKPTTACRASPTAAPRSGTIASARWIAA